MEKGRVLARAGVNIGAGTEKLDDVYGTGWVQ